MFRFPFTDIHELNLDWIISKIKHIDERTKRIVNSINGSTGDVIIPIPSPATTNPKPLGQYPAIGIDDNYARADHVHPMPEGLEVTYDLEGDSLPVRHIVSDGADSVQFIKPSSIDDIAFGNLTYRDIFITNNIVKNGSFSTGDMQDWEINSGSPIIEQSVVNTKSYALKCYGAISTQVKQTLTLIPGHHYWFGSWVYPVRITSGYCGVAIGTTYARRQIIADTFKVVWSYLTPTQNTSTLFVGSMSSADADCYIDDIFCIDLDALFPGADLSTSDAKRPYVVSILLAQIQYFEMINHDTYIYARQHIPSHIQFVTSVMYATSDINRFLATKIALAIAERKLLGADTQYYEGLMLAYATNVSVAILPNRPAMYRQQQPTPIYSINGDIAAVPASVTKVVTAITALPFIISIKDHYTITSDDIHTGSGNVFQDGDVVTIEDLLYAMMLPSSNTAAHAIGHYVGVIILNDPSASAAACESAFVSEMNATAAKLGMNDSTFINPSGITTGGIENTTTANDMLKAGIEAASWDVLNRIWNVNSYTVHVTGANARDITLQTTVTYAALEEDYRILGGKTGSSSSVNPPAYSLITITEAKKYKIP